LRDIPFTTQVFKRYSRKEKILENTIVKSYLHGVATLKVKQIISEFGVENVSASKVSKISQELYEKVNEFLSKPI